MYSGDAILCRVTVNALVREDDGHGAGRVNIESQVNLTVLLIEVFYALLDAVGGGLDGQVERRLRR